MIVKKNSAFTLIETMIALVISVIAVGAIYSSYTFFNKSYQTLLDKASLSKSGRTSLSIITKDLRNAGYKNKHYNRAFDRSIEQVDNYNGTGADSLVLWYNTSANERLRIRYYLKDNSAERGGKFLAREVVENPATGSDARLRHCKNYRNQRGCVPQNIIPFVTDFQVIFKDVDGNPLQPVCAPKAPVDKASPSTPSCSEVGKENQKKVHTAEIFVTVRSPNQIYRKNRVTKILNFDSTIGKEQTITDKFLRETFYTSVYLRNIIKM